MSQRDGKSGDLLSDIGFVNRLDELNPHWVIIWKIGREIVELELECGIVEWEVDREIIDWEVDWQIVDWEIVDWEIVDWESVHCESVMDG